MEKQEFLNTKIDEIIDQYPFMNDYFLGYDNIFLNFSQSIISNTSQIKEGDIENLALDINLLIENAYEYFKQMVDFLNLDNDRVKSITILKGYDKNKVKEKYDIKIEVGQIIAIVGLTGSGKSRLLADIEWIADRDTPTNRKILINDKETDKKWRYSSTNKIVAQLSQNMNFVMDLSVKEFLELHASSRLVENVDEVVSKIIDEANSLAGEKFTCESQITSLSGGQSRALMIADTAILSKSPIVLIDEIENAGIDRKKALNLLVKEEKIVLMVTHDPILALMANKRIVIKNGGINKVIHTSADEKMMLKHLQKIDSYLMEKRQEIRLGNKLDIDNFI